MIQLLLRFKASPLLTAKDGFTALHFAAQKDSGSQSCAYLVAKSAKLLHMKVSKGKKTALHLAVSKGNTQVAKKLLELGADPTTRSGSGQSCLELCPSSNAELKIILTQALSNRDEAKSNPSEVAATRESAMSTADKAAHQTSSSSPHPQHLSSSINVKIDDMGSVQSYSEKTDTGGQWASEGSSFIVQAQHMQSSLHNKLTDVDSSVPKKRKVISSMLLDDDE